MGAGRPRFPCALHGSWFRRDAAGALLWPGFGDNLRVLAWIVARARGEAGAVEAPIGLVPPEGALDLDGLPLGRDATRALCDVDREAWRGDAAELGTFLRSFGARTPEALWREHRSLSARLGPGGDLPS